MIWLDLPSCNVNKIWHGGLQPLSPTASPRARKAGNARSHPLFCAACVEGIEKLKPSLKYLFPNITGAARALTGL